MVGALVVSGWSVSTRTDGDLISEARACPGRFVRLPVSTSGMSCRFEH